MRHIKVLDTKRSYTAVPVPQRRIPDLIRQQGEFWDWLMEHPGGGFSVGSHHLFIYDERDVAVYLLRWA